MTSAALITSRPSCFKFYLPCPFLFFPPAPLVAHIQKKRIHFSQKIGLPNYKHQKWCGCALVCVYVQALSPLEKYFLNFIKPNVVPVPLGLNADNSQLIINALLILPKCQVTQIVGGLFHTNTHTPTHTNTKEHSARGQNVSIGTKRTIHKSSVPNQPNQDEKKK